MDMVKAASKQSPLAARWCYTNNNPLPTESIPDSEVVYHIFGNEIAPETNTPHQQGFVIFQKRLRLTAVKKFLPRAHWEIAKGTDEQNVTYCSKSDANPTIYGVLPTKKNGGKLDRNSVASQALSSATVEEGLEIFKHQQPFYFCLHGEAIRRNLQSCKVNFAPNKVYALSDFLHVPLAFTKSTLVHGDSGTGKTSFVLAHFTNPCFVRHIDGLKRFIPGDNDAIVFDDVSFKHWPPESIIQLLDMEQPAEIHVRYGTTIIPSGTLRVFTHNDPNPFYNSEVISDFQKTAIERRLNRVKVLNNLYK
ncbi:MAG: replication associated protein [Cressdnaviricota sp.]|nr:MAG: replication associated protein [Cressdnaviricota sp.]